MIDMEWAQALGLNAAQSLGLLAFAGTLAGTLRWRRAARRDFLLAFIVFLAGTALAQLPVHLGGMVGWGVDLVLTSAAGRLVQNLGAVLFIRASLRDECPAWGWVSVVGLVMFLTWLL